MAHAIDGNLADWTSADRLDRPGTGTTGYQLYGTIETQGTGATAAKSYVFALTAPTAIPDNTIFWLNTDQKIGTGLYPNSVGAEYYVNFVGGVPYLYSGSNPGVPLSALNHAFSTDKHAVEFSVPLSDIGETATPGLDLKVDVNGAKLPVDYTTTTYTVTDPAALPPATAHTLKVGIVYSATTAAHYFGTVDPEVGKTAYGQLFMAAQNQATAAGVPFDVLSEADLKDLAKVSGYDALVFPSFRNVATADVAQIQSVLTDAVYKYHVGLITAGDFMTNDENGAALAGDPYARMKTLLDLQREGGTTAPDPVGVTATGAGFTGYAAGESVRSYATMSTSWYASADGTAPTVIANQSVTEGTTTATHEAVVGTVTGGRNVHFANESLLGDNNMLQHAIGYVVDPASGPVVDLHMSRDKAIVASRTDMDQAKEPTDVKPANGSPGIYDKLLPILDQWKAAYNFVGSYYVDIGDGTGGSQTNWTVSQPYYDHLLAAGNEIGSHSITHPDDTGKLTAAQIQSEFQGSKTILDQHLPTPITGAAVPGMPELLKTSQAIEQYYTYITGGATLVGAGYPGAIGHLVPGDDKVYIAPNMSFDFTLVGFQKLTPEAAEAAWAKEWTTNTAHSDLPIVVWPWHDYGPTNWVTDENTPPTYTTQMFTDFIAKAYSYGSEFVTLADLAQRVASFDKSTLQYSYDATAKLVTATVATADAGKFALDLSRLDAGSKIKSVAGYYAYDDDSVFVDKDGGTFAVSLGTAADDVTHLIKIADRAELVSVTGDGTNLGFTVVGEGNYVIDLKDPTGKVVTVTSDGKAITPLVSGDKMTVTLTGLGSHTVSVAMTTPTTPTNHAPTVDKALTADLTEGGAKGSYDLLVGAKDADGDTLAVANLTYKVGTGAAAATAPAGLVYDTATHTLSADPANPAFDHLALGAKETIVVAYDVVDGKGAKVAQTETLTITGTNDAPVLAKALTEALKVGETRSADLLAGASDPDDGETATLSVTGLSFKIGTAAMVATMPDGVAVNGHTLTFAPGQNAAFSALTTADTKTLVVDYDVTDVHGAKMHQMETFTVTGIVAPPSGGSGATPGGGSSGGSTGGGSTGGGSTGGGSAGGGTTPGGGSSGGGATGGTGTGGGALTGGSGTAETEHRGHFGDVSHDPHSLAGEVYALYDATFDRTPDMPGQQYWTDRHGTGLSLHDLAQALMQSAEGQAHLGMAGDAAFVEALYQTALHRASDAVGMQHWTDVLHQGADRADVAISFAFSAENMAGMQSAFDAGIFTANDRAMDVARLYYGVLDRAPDAGGLDAFANAAGSGASLQSIAQAMLGSGEYAAKLGSLTDAAFVEALYHGALGRGAEGAGLQAWSAALSAGASRADVAVAIAESGEAHQHHLGQIETGWHLVA